MKIILVSSNQAGHRPLSYLIRKKESMKKLAYIMCAATGALCAILYAADGGSGRLALTISFGVIAYLLAQDSKKSI